MIDDTTGAESVSVDLDGDGVASGASGSDIARTEVPNDIARQEAHQPTADDTGRAEMGAWTAVNTPSVA